jgi:hypothetical protein
MIYASICIFELYSKPYSRISVTISVQYILAIFSGAMTMLTKATQELAVRCYGRELAPGANFSDCSAGIRNGFLATWPDAPHGQCYPHIARKLREGEFCSKTHPHFDEIGLHLECIHLCQSEDMRNCMTHEIGKKWDSWGDGNNLEKFWDVYCVAPWNNWSIGLFPGMFLTPSQQAQESWHNLILRSRIPGMFKGSTASVFSVALPKLISLDGYLMPDVLSFTVPQVPLGMYKKAFWYVQHRLARLYLVKRGDDEFYYVLSKQSTTFKLLDSTLVKQYQTLYHGDIPKGIKKLETLMALVKDIHVVVTGEQAPYCCPECPANPLGMACNCKGFRQYGICSHVIAVNHWLDAIDLEALLEDFGTASRKKGGYMKGVRPALTKEFDGPSSAIKKKRKRLK